MENYFLPVLASIAMMTNMYVCIWAVEGYGASMTLSINGKVRTWIACLSFLSLGTILMLLGEVGRCNW